MLLGACAGGSSSTVQLGTGEVFQVDIADDAAERELGLSGRPELPAGTGMLFVYEEAEPRHFWMVDMRFPIDLAWIRDGSVLEVRTLPPCPSREDCPSHPSPGPVDRVLEVPAGALGGVDPGTAVLVS